MRELFVVALLLIGTVFVTLAAVGILRMPDLLTRMQTTGKAITLGLGCLMLAEALHFARFDTTVRFVTVIAFFALTAPVAAHAIARAAYLIGIPLWSGSVVDHLRERHGFAADGVGERSAGGERRA